jgi:allophanate hydrolase subunit 1
MSAFLIGNNKRFIGLSSDTKPTTSVQIGSLFIEYDTALWYVYAGSVGGWQVIGKGGMTWL